MGLIKLVKQTKDWLMNSDFTIWWSGCHTTRRLNQQRLKSQTPPRKIPWSRMDHRIKLIEAPRLVNPALPPISVYQVNFIGAIRMLYEIQIGQKPFKLLFHVLQCFHLNRCTTDNLLMCKSDPITWLNQELDLHVYHSFKHSHVNWSKNMSKISLFFWCYKHVIVMFLT